MAEELARCGVRHAVLSPGSRSTPLALALWREPAIEIAVVSTSARPGSSRSARRQATRSPGGRSCAPPAPRPPTSTPRSPRPTRPRVPLIVLTADRPPELRGIGAGQTIDQIKLYGSAVRWFCEVGSHDADDDGLLHFRSVACRACAAARGEPRPGPVHLNIPLREPLGPAAEIGRGRGDVAARPRRAAAIGPLTAVSPAPARSRQRAPRRARRADRRTSRSGPDRRRPPDRPRARPSGGGARGRLRLPDPARADLAAPLRRPRPLARRLGLRLDRARPPRLPGAGPRPAVRRDADLASSLRDVDRRRPSPSRSSIAPHGWNEPTNRADEIVRADPAAVAKGLASRLGPARAAGAAVHWTADWLRAGERAAAAIRSDLEGESEPSEPGVHAALGGLYADGDLVYTASSMPIRDQEAFCAAARGRGHVPGQPGRERHRRPGLVGRRRGDRHRPPHLDRHRRPRARPRRGRPRRDRDMRTRRSDRDRDQQRGRRHLRVPAAGGA